MNAPDAVFHTLGQLYDFYGRIAKYRLPAERERSRKAAKRSQRTGKNSLKSVPKGCISTLPQIHSIH